MRPFLFLVIATCMCSPIACQEFPLNYSLVSIEAGAGECLATQDQVESIWQGIDSLIDSVVLPTIERPCSCGGPGWRRAAYLNVSDPTQTCPPAWALVTNLRRSCARPSNATFRSCYSALFPSQGSVEESLDIREDYQQHSIVVKGGLLMVTMLME